jgi:nucleotide-binding universal stress UspA family protein
MNGIGQSVQPHRARYRVNTSLRIRALQPMILSFNPSRAVHPKHPTFLSIQEARMYQHIILAYDGSVSGQKALIELKELAHWGQPRLTLVAVAPNPLDVGSMEMGYYTSVDPEPLQETLQEQLAQGVKSLQAMGFAVNGEILKGEIIHELTQFAERAKADLIVVGHKHEKNILRRWWSGSTAKSLVEESPCNVLIVVAREH